jgi:SPP1 gp7 family putative phage head morphogenesis protein
MIENGYQLQPGDRIQYLDLEKQDPKQVAPTEQTKTNTAEKKKLSHKQINNNVNLFYDNSSIELANFTGIDIAIFNKVMERILNLAKDNNLPADNDLVKNAIELVSATYQQLSQAFDEGIKLSKYTPDKAFIKKLKSGLWNFSGLKTQAQLLEAKALLFDDKGEVKVWNKFRDDILSIHENYNINYLRSEYDFTISSSQAASKWQEHEANKELIYLQYRTAGDERVRSSHQALDGITLPVDDPFWDSFYIPNGWGCRCNVVEVLRTRYKATDSKKAMDAGEASMIVSNSNGTINEKATAKNQIFKFNPGKQEMIFPEGHPYYDLANKKLDKNIGGLK